MMISDEFDILKDKLVAFIREDCLRNMHWQFGTWESLQQLLNIMRNQKELIGLYKNPVRTSQETPPLMQTSRLSSPGN